MHEEERIGKFIPLMQSLYGAARENLGFKPHAKIYIIKSGENMQNPLGKTAHYSPSEHKIGLYTQGRHIKDILRSLAHELVHHNQNCRGDFEHAGETMAGYAQEDGHLREMEREAYECGNMIFRDWEDSLKEKGGKPLFTSTSQYVPSPTSDVVGMPLLERKQMSKKLNEQGPEEREAQVAKDKRKQTLAQQQAQAQRQALKERPDAKNYKTETGAGCKKYLKDVETWAKKHEIPPEQMRKIAKCKMPSTKPRKGSTLVDAFGTLLGTNLNVGLERQRRAGKFDAKPPHQTKPTYAEGKSLFEGNKMNKELKESQLRTIVRGIIQEMVNEDNMGMPPNVEQQESDEQGSEAAAAAATTTAGGDNTGQDYQVQTEGEEMTPRERANRECAKKFRPGQAAHGACVRQKLRRIKKENKEVSKRKLKETAMGQFDQGVTTDDNLPAVGYEKGTVFEDSGESEAWNDWKNEHADDDHIKEMEHHLRALKGDRDYERKSAEYDHDDYEDDRKDESLNEDSGEEEAWNDWKNEHADDDHIKELEHHLRALKEDRDYERKGAEYDHDKYEDEGYDDKDKDKDVDEEVEVVELAETFFPKGRSVRQKARTDLNEALMKRWSKIIK